MKKIIWKFITGYEDYYEVSNTGKVRSVERLVNHVDGRKRLMKSRELKPRISYKGYLGIVLAKEGKNKGSNIHRIVALTFIPNPENKLFVNHKNGIKTDNSVGNLEWCTMEENQRHAIETGLCKTIVTPFIIRNARLLYAKNLPVKQIAGKLCVSYSTVYCIVTGRTWKS